MGLLSKINPIKGSLKDIAADLGFRNSFDPFENLKNPLSSMGFSNGQQVEEGQDTLDEVMDMFNGTSSQNEADLQAYYDKVSGKYGGDEDAFRQAVADYLGYDTTPVEDFTFSGSVEDYMDPAAELRKQNAMTSINDSMSGDGNRFSSDFLKKLSHQQQLMASEEWEKSYNRLMDERNAQMNEWQANADNQRANQQAELDKLKSAMDIYGQGNDKMDTALEELISGIVNNRNTNMQTTADVMQGKADLAMQEESGLPHFLGTIFKGIAGGG